MISMTNVYKSYENGTKAIRGINMHIDDGEFAFLVGPSGSGKSTILKLITGEIFSTEGTVIINGFDMNKIKPSDLPKLRRTLGVIFQDFRLIEKKNVYENVAFAMRVVGATNKEIRKRVSYVLELVGLDTKTRKSPMSCRGEQQRVAIARALVIIPGV